MVLFFPINPENNLGTLQDMQHIIISTFYLSRKKEKKRRYAAYHLMVV